MAVAAFCLPQTLRAQIEREARAAFPRECCGLIEGEVENNKACATTLYPARNLAVDADRFEIDPKNHFRAIHAARAAGRAIIGCYHSHPNGHAMPSARDTAGAMDEDFIWVIAATGDDRLTISAFTVSRQEFLPLRLSDKA